MRFRRLVAFALSIVVLLSSMTPAYATSRGLDDEVAEYVIVPFANMVVSGVESIGRMLDSVQGEAFDLIYNCYEFWSGLISDAVLDYNGFVEGLDYTTVTHDGLFIIRPMVPWSVGSSIWSNSDLMDVPGGWSFSGYAYGTSTSYNRGSFSCKSDELFYVPPGMYKITTSRSGYWGEERYTPSAKLCLRNADGEQVFNGSSGSSVSLIESHYYADSLSVNYTYWVSGGWYSGSYYDVGAEFELECLDLYDGADIEMPGKEARVASISAVLNEWNSKNAIQPGDTTINYYISPVDTEDTYYHPGLYDEETLVYTDPVTGMEYLTTGWTYDYLTRCYSLTMGDTFLIGDTVISTIDLTYGDDVLTIDHYDSDGNLVQSDTYNYVMASGSECGLGDHSYIYETAVEPGCTSVGERKYTCTVCGDEYAEEIPANGHTYTYETVLEPTCTSLGERKYTCTVCGDEYNEDVPSTEHPFTYSVMKEPTCTANGVGTYTCAECGMQYTESIPATNHTPVVLETVPSEYDENGVQITVGYTLYECSVCGTQYTVSDEVSIEKEGWFSWIGSLFKKLISSIVNGLATGLEWFTENIIKAVTDWIVQLGKWCMSLFDGSALSSFLNWFSPGNQTWNDEFSGVTFPGVEVA